MIEIPVWEKYTLSIEEAAAYFRIGENKLRQLIAENPNADYILWNGTRAQIKRKIWVFTHKSKMQTPNGGVRTDRLCSEIAKAINGSRYYGLGELEMYSVKRFCPITDYIGKVMMFQTQEFNRQSPTGKAIPSNRKGH